MVSSVFSKIEFWLLVLLSFVVPFGIYIALLIKRTVAEKTVLVLGAVLVVISGLDVYLLQELKSLAEQSPSLADDAIFVSSISVALYVLPAMFGGIGINLLSHVLINHLNAAERRFKKEHHEP